MKKHNKLENTDIKYLMIDYIKNKLDKDTKLIFEQYLENDAELKSEFIEMKNTLNKLNNIEYNDLFSKYTRNLSVKVNNQLERNRSFAINKYYKFLVPMLSAVVIILIVLNVNFNDKYSETNQKFDTNFQLDETELSIFFDEVNAEETVSLTLSKSNLTNIDKIIEDHDNESIQLIYDEFMENSIIDDENLYKTFSNEKSVKTTINELNDEEFKKLLKELKNVEIIS